MASSKQNLYGEYFRNLWMIEDCHHDGLFEGEHIMLVIGCW